MTERNEKRSGFKKTKVGWLPEEWEVLPAGEVFDIQLGKMLSKKARQGKNLQPYLANYNVQWGGFDLSKIQKMDFSDREMKKFQLKKGDLLVCEGGEVGRFAVWDEQISPCFYQKALHCVRPRIEGIDVFFAMYYVHLTSNSSRMVNYTAQTSISHFTREQFLKFPVALPPLPEQKKIAEILFTWDTAIEKTRHLISAKQHVKKALMQQLLIGKKRLPGFGTPASEEDRDPDGWKEMKLSQTFERVQRTTTKDVEDVLSITATVGFVQQKDKFSRIIAGQNLKRYILLKKGEFAYNKGNSKTYPQGCVYMLEGIDEAAVPNVYFCFRPQNTKICGQFHKFYFENGLLNYQLQRVINTGVRNDGLLNLNPNDFFSIRIKVPPISEQKRIKMVLSTATYEINHLQKKLKALEKQKRGLMQKLLTGEVRVTG